MPFRVANPRAQAGRILLVPAERGGAAPVLGVREGVSERNKCNERHCD